jgi:hypothetical protein
MAHAIIVIKDFDGNVKEGDDIQIHKWLKPNSESRKAIADGKVVKVIINPGDPDIQEVK